MTDIENINAKILSLDKDKFHLIFIDANAIDFDSLINLPLNEYKPPVVFIACYEKENLQDSIKKLSFDTIVALENFVNELKLENKKEII